MANPLPQDGSNGDKRGIQNATARFEERTRERLMSEQLQNKAGRVNSRAVKKAEQERELDAVLREDADFASQFNSNTARMVLENRPVAPNFPFLMLMLAGIKDFLDTADLIIIGILFTTALSFVLSLIIFFWIIGRLSGGWWKKWLTRKLWMRYIVMVFIEFMPFFKVIPATTIMILMTHYSETKVVKMFDAALKKMG